MQSRNGAIQLGLLLAGICVLLGACGVKAPPLPPAYNPPAAVTDLRYALEDDGVIVLRWTLPEKGAQQTGRPERAKVFRARESLQDPACDTCALKYRKIREVPLETGNLVFREGLEKGYRYHYKLVIVDDTDRESNDSNVVSLDYE